MDPFGLDKVQFLGLFETNNVVRFGHVRSQMALTSLDLSRLLETFIEKLISEVRGDQKWVSAPLLRENIKTTAELIKENTSVLSSG